MRPRKSYFCAKTEGEPTAPAYAKASAGKTAYCNCLLVLPPATALCH
ncbi:MAG: hypothetical protein IPH31_11095 [Lewinellaceae bacterium]|nr:hypothetical protein [Lewinellaceae bacterium]